MDDFLNDEQLRRLFERNLPKQQPSPEFVENLVRRVQAEVRATYSGEQRANPVAHQLVSRRPGNENAAPSSLPKPQIPHPNGGNTRGSGRSWIFSSTSATWMSFGGTVAAILLLAVLFTRTDMRDAIKTMAGGDVKPGATKEKIVAFAPTDTASVTAQTPTGEMLLTVTPAAEGVAPTDTQPQVNEPATEPSIEQEKPVVDVAPTKSVIDSIFGSPTPTPDDALPSTENLSVRTPTTVAMADQTAIAQNPNNGSNSAATSGSGGATSTRTPNSPNTNSGTVPTLTRTPTPIKTLTKTPTAQPVTTKTNPQNDAGLPLASPTPTDVFVGVAQPNATSTRVVVPTPTRSNSLRPSPTATATSSSAVIRPVSPSYTATPTATTRVVVPPTYTATATASWTPVRSSTNTPSPTRTPSPTTTPSATATPSLTNTPIPTSTPTQTATVTPSPLPTNSAPMVSLKTYEVDEDTGVPLPVLSAVIDNDRDTVSLKEVSAPARGTATIQGNQVFYLPEEDFSGEDQFTITVSDGKVSVTGVVNVVVKPINDSPIARMAPGEGLEDSAIIIKPLESVSDVDGPTLRLVSVDKPDHGSAQIQNNTEVVYTPQPGFTGSDTFAYYVSDGDQPVKGLISVNVFNRAPVANDSSFTVQEDTSATMTVDVEDSASDVLRIVNVSAQNGTVSISGINMTYTPGANFFGADTIQYTVSDGDKSDSASVQVTVEPVNDPPTVNANIQALRVVEDTEASFNPLDNATDIDTIELRVESYEQPQNGSLRLESGRLIYSPNPNYSGTDQVKYVVTDGSASVNVTVDVTVEPVSDPPQASDFTMTVDKNSSVTVDVTTYVNDLDSYPLTIVVMTPPLNGTVQVEGYRVTYRPNPSFTGDDSFVYGAGDGASMATANVSISVTQKNEEETPTPDSTPDFEPTATLPDTTPTNEGDASDIQAASDTSETSEAQP